MLPDRLMRRSVDERDASGGCGIRGPRSSRSEASPGNRSPERARTCPHGRGRPSDVDLETQTGRTDDDLRRHGEDQRDRRADAQAGQDVGKRRGQQDVDHLRDRDSPNVRAVSSAVGLTSLTPYIVCIRIGQKGRERREEDLSSRPAPKTATRPGRARRTGSDGGTRPERGRTGTGCCSSRARCRGMPSAAARPRPPAQPISVSATADQNWLLNSRVAPTRRTWPSSRGNAGDR